MFFGIPLIIKSSAAQPEITGQVDDRGTGIAVFFDKIHRDTVWKTQKDGIICGRINILGGNHFFIKKATELRIYFIKPDARPGTGGDVCNFNIGMIQKQPDQFGTGVAGSPCYDDSNFTHFFQPSLVLLRLSER